MLIVVGSAACVCLVGVEDAASPVLGCPMLIVRCAACRRKLFRYRKIGKGEVLRCHKERITRLFEAEERDGRLWCPCGRAVGVDMGTRWNMLGGTFTYSGTKDNS